MSGLRTHLDFETRSLADLPKVGEHAYAQHWSTSPLMLAYGTAPYGQIPELELTDFFADPRYAASRYPAPDAAWKVFAPPCPPVILAGITRGDTFVAHNARFEQSIYYYVCHLQWGWPMPVRWSCTAARARYHGIRASLDGAASDLEVIVQKDTRGKEFINNFCKPRKYKGAKALGVVKELWYEPHENPQGWQEGKEYCLTDVNAESHVDAVLPDLPPFEQAAWEWDFAINVRGVPIDVESVKRAQQFSDVFTAAAFARFEELTALRPTQRDRVLEYLQQRDEIENLGNLRSKTLKRLTLADFPPDLQDVIQIRLDCSLASTKKLATMERTTDKDGMARGIHLYGGAHTMRWSAKRVQTQNMKRGDRKTQAHMFRFLEDSVWTDPPPPMGGNGGPRLIDGPMVPAWLHDARWRFLRPLQSLSLSMRGFVAAPRGKVLRAADFAQIEARVLAWLARAMRKLDAFRDKQDLYCKFAGVMYSRAYDDYFELYEGKRRVKPALGFERQVAKSAELGCGFGLGGPKFVEYCDNSDIIIDEETAKNVVGTWREDNPEIVELWSRVETAAVLAVANEGEEYQLAGTDVSFKVWRIDSERYWLLCKLPSGHAIHYYRPKIQLGERWGRTVEKLTFRREWNGMSYREDTYGGKLVENMVQAIARDIMVVGGLRAEAAGYPVVMLVHDEAVTLCPEDFGSHEELCALMCMQEPWITDLPIEAEGASMFRYGK